MTRVHLPLCPCCAQRAGTNSFSWPSENWDAEYVGEPLICAECATLIKTKVAGFITLRRLVGAFQGKNPLVTDVRFVDEGKPLGNVSHLMISGLLPEQPNEQYDSFIVSYTALGFDVAVGSSPVCSCRKLGTAIHYVMRYAQPFPTAWDKILTEEVGGTE